MAIYKYIDEKTGKTKYWLKGYIGVDPLTGKEKRVNRKGFVSKKQAELALAKLQLGISKTNVKTPKFKELYDSWLIPYETSVKPSTFTTISDIFRLHILPDFGDIYVDKITPEMVQEWVNKKYKNNYSKFREFHGYMSTIMELAVGRRHTTFNPCNSTIFPKIEGTFDKEDLIIWTKEELAEFLDLVQVTKSLKWYAFFRLIAYTGMRRGEMLALEWSDIDFVNKTVSINKSRKVAPNPEFKDGNGKPRKIEITGNTKTGDKRTISLDQKTLDILMNWKKLQTKILGLRKVIFNNSTLGNKTGEYIGLNYPIKVLNSIIKRFGLREIDIHRFRHIHTTMLIVANKNKNSLATIMHRLGHSDITTTLNIYNHIVQEEKEEILDNFISFVS